MTNNVTRIAVIGLGMRALQLVKLFLEMHPDARLAAVADPDISGVRGRLQEAELLNDGIRFFADADALLEEAERYDGVMIGTRCHLHTPMALKVAPTRLPLFLEKPVAITTQQVHDLYQAFRGREDSVVVSFPLRVTPMVSDAMEVIESGRLGTINQIQAFNNVTYGGAYFGYWYRNYDEVGGLWLQKATHDLDFINRLMGCNPTQIAATTTQAIYGGDKPFDLRCSRCDLTQTCPESPQNLVLRGDDGGMMPGQPLDVNSDHACAFSEGIKNQDSGSALVLYENGAHANYSQNFITRRKAGRRGAIVTGYKATMEFDWYTGLLSVFDHRSDDVEQKEIKTLGGHGGGDAVLLRSFMDVIRGESRPVATLREGLLSATMCLAARESSFSNTFQNVCPPWEMDSLVLQNGAASAANGLAAINGLTAMRHGR